MNTNTITSYDDGLNYYPEAKRGSPGPSFLTKLRLVWEAMSEATAASRRYHELTARGMSPDQAAAKVFSEHYGAK